MTLEQLEAEVLALPEESQILLLRRLLAQVAQTVDIDPEITEAWITEAQKRDESLNIGQANGIPAPTVFQNIRARFQ